MLQSNVSAADTAAFTKALTQSLREVSKLREHAGLRVQPKVKGCTWKTEVTEHGRLGKDS